MVISLTTILLATIAKKTCVGAQSNNLRLWFSSLGCSGSLREPSPVSLTYGTGTCSTKTLSDHHQKLCCSFMKKWWSDQATILHMSWQLSCATVWPDLNARVIIKGKRIFTWFQLQAHKLLVKWIPGAGWNTGTTKLQPNRCLKNLPHNMGLCRRLKFFFREDKDTLIKQSS